MAKSCLRSLWMLPKDNSFENNLNINGLENLLLKWGKNWLELVLDAYCFREFDGFYAVNDFSDKFPTVAKTTVLIRAGHNNFVAMGVTKVSADEGIRDLEPSNEIVYSMTK